MIELKNVDFTYQNSQDGAGVHNIDLTIPQGQVVLLCGSSGCGKTTLTRMINGLIPHFYEGKLSGDITVCDMSTANCDLHEIAPYVGSVFQNPKSQFYTVKTDTEIVFGCENIGMNKEQILSNFEKTIEELEVSPLLGKSLFSLSGGEKQKIACASVAALLPSVIVMDEPTSNLDIKTISYMKSLLKRWKQEGKTIVIAEHRLHWLMDIADRVIYMKNGYIERDVKIEEFKNYSTETLHKMGLRKSVSTENAPHNYSENSRHIKFENFNFSYKDSKHDTMHIENLSVPIGSVIGVLGNNGAGKTTFGRCLCGLEKKAKGSVILEDKEINLKQRIALSYIVMQDVNHQLFTESVFDEILLSMEKSSGTSHEKEEHALEILRRLKIDEYKDRHPMSLSGGQKQRTAIASALASGKKLLVYDEPTSGLDYMHMLDVAEAIREMKSPDHTQFIITHDSELVSQCCDYIIIMQSGKITTHGPLSDKSVSETVKRFWLQIND